MDTLVSTFELEATRGTPNEAEVWLAEGVVLALTEPGRAKDLLSKAAENLSGDLFDKARIWLACCYWAAGEKEEARAVLNSVAPQSVECKFLWGSTMASMVSVPEAIEHLDRAGLLLDQIGDPLAKGKFFNQRAVALRRSGDPDGAIIAYTGLQFWAEEAGDSSLVAVSANNLADLLHEIGQCDDAHRQVDKAIVEYGRLRKEVYLAQALDTKGQIFLTEQKFSEAEKCALRSVNLLANKEQKKLLAESLITHAKSLMGQEKYLEAHGRLERARGIGDYLGNTELLFDVSWELRELSKKLRTKSEYDLISIALKEGSLRSAAKKMKVTHPAFTKLANKHKLSLAKPVRRVLNARKK